MHILLYVDVYIDKHAHTFATACIHTYVHTYIPVVKFPSFRIQGRTPSRSVRRTFICELVIRGCYVCIPVYVCMYVCMYGVRVCVYLYVYVCMYTYMVCAADLYT
jgi:hypothetical protein